MNINIKSDSRSLKWLAFFVPSILILLAIWLPFGFSLTGLIEEWGILGVFNHFGTFFITNIGGPMAGQALRPFTVFPHALAYFLDPDSFNYWHVLLIASLLLKGVAGSTLFWQATGSLRFAALAGLLMIIYPADTMQLSFRGLHINLALSLLLLASSLMIAAFRQPKTSRSYSLGLGAAFLLWVALGMYEASLTLVFLPFMLIYASDGLRASLKLMLARKGLVFIWLFSFGLYLVFLVFVSSHLEQSYQKTLMHQASVSLLKSRFMNLLNPGLIRSLLSGWFDAFGILLKEIGFLGYLYILSTTTLICGFLLCVIKKEHGKDSQQKQLMPLLRLALVGLVLSILGYFPYGFSGVFTSVSQRTYLFATPGAAIFWSALLMMIAGWRRILASSLACLFLVLGLGFQLFQFHHYVQISQTQTLLLRNIIANYDGKPDKKTLLLLDGSNLLLHTWMFTSTILPTILNYFYGHPIDALFICQMPGKEWRPMIQVHRLAGACIEEDKKWILRDPATVTGPGYQSPPSAPDKIIAKDEALILTINPDGSVVPNPSLAAYRDSLQKANSHLAKRYRNILSPSTWTTHFDKLWAPISPEKYKWSFGNWWGFDHPIPGSGWYEADWILGKFRNHAVAWKSQEDARINFNLVPAKGSYRLRGKFNSILTDQIRESIRIVINQRTVPYQLLPNGKFESQLPDDLLVSGLNSITFHSKIDLTYYGLSLQMAWFEIVPERLINKEST